MLTVDNVHKSFGDVRAVQGVSFDVRPGEVVGLLGPNGAGKTTTIRMITGFLAPDEGRISIHGFDTLTQPRVAKQAIGYLPESAPMYPEMRVVDYLHFRAKLFGVDRHSRRRAVSWCLERCRIEDVARRRIGVLSKGYKQRVGLAAALLHNPPVLVLDEPTNGLDPSQIGETRSLIRELTFERTLVLCSHILPEVERLCSRIVIIAGGRVRADGSATAIADPTDQAPYRIQTRATTNHEQALTRTALDSITQLERIEVVEVPGNMNSIEGGVRWVTWNLYPKPGGEDIRELIGATLIQAQISLRELTRIRPTLEQAFLRAVETPAEASK